MAKLQSGTQVFGNLIVNSNVTIGGGIYTTTGLFWAANNNVIATGGGGGGGAAGLSGTIQYNASGVLGSVQTLYYYPGNTSVVANAGVASTSTTSGSFQVLGGAGITGNLYVGGNLVVTGTQTFTNTETVNATEYVATINATNLYAATVGNIGANIVGTGTYLTSLNASNLSTGTVSALLIPTLNQNTTGSAGSAPAGSLTGSTLASGVTASSLTSVGTLTGLTVSGSATMSATLPVFAGAIFTAQNFDPGQFNLSTYGGGTAASGRSAIGWNRSGGRGEMSFINNMDGGSPGGFSFYNWANTQTNTTTTTFSIDNTGLVTAYNNIVPSANVSYNLGSSTAWWNTVYGTAIHAQYADLAENYTADAEYAPGTVVVFGGDKEITTTVTSHDTRVAGVISTNPAYLMNGASPGLPVAMTGRVPCQVQGPVNKGTVLVTSTTAGVAKAIDNSKFLPGCIVGKALESINTNTIETIEVVVGRF